MKPLTPRQRQALAYIVAHTTRHGSPPTLREIAFALGNIHGNAAKQLLEQLVQRGLVARDENVARGIRVLGLETRITDRPEGQQLREYLAGEQ